MRHALKHAQLIWLIAFVALILPATASADDGTQATTVCSDLSSSKANDVLVVRLQFSGDPAAPAKNAIGDETLTRLTRRFKKLGEEWFRQHLGSQGLELKLEVGVRGIHDASDESAHQVTVVNGPQRDFVYHYPFFGVDDFGKQRYSKWGIDTLTDSDPRVGLHESMHMASIPDAYGYYYHTSSGALSELPKGMITNGGFGNPVVDPDLWVWWGDQQGIDIKRLKVEVLARPGHENDLMAIHNTATRLLPADVGFLRSKARHCKRDVLSDVDSPRTCYSAPDSLRVRGLSKFVPFSRIEHAETSLPRYPATAGKAFNVRMSCTFSAEAKYVRNLMDQAVTQQIDAKERQEELDNASSEVIPAKQRELIQKQISQLFLNASALAHEAMYRNATAHILVVHDRSGYGTAREGKVRKLANEVTEFLRQFSGA